MSYSQGAEEETILEIFNGYISESGPPWLLDIGCYDGKTFSNSLALIEQGWNALLVDASPRAFSAAVELHKDNPNVQLLCAAVSTSSGIIELQECADAVSSTEVGNVKTWADNGTQFWPIFVQAVTLHDIINRFGGPWDFVNIDVEGTSLHLFHELMNIEETSGWPSAICVEHDGYSVEIAERSSKRGFSTRFLDGNNIIIARKP